MTIRPLDILDLPFIHRYRNQALTLDSLRSLTRGNPLGPVGFMSYLNPARHVYSAVSQENGTTLLGGIIHTRDKPFARLYYVAPINELDNPALPELIEDLTNQAGVWGAFHVIADIDQNHLLYPILRQVGFSVYAWQRIWDISNLDKQDNSPGDWINARSIHQTTIQNLYYQIVPPLMHPVEPFEKNANGVICKDDRKCYSLIWSGIYGIVLTPLIHPEVTNVADKLISLFRHIPDKRGRPIYMCVRSYQAWLEPVLEDLGARPSERQAIMVKHLVRFIHDEQTVPSVPSPVSIQPSGYKQINGKK
ncbi:MAG: hypothetical protein JXA13_02940 [Anaerolineales bacterium]|nr:hypothetical protein [Anaerolineales bacterium]